MKTKHLFFTSILSVLFFISASTEAKAQKIVQFSQYKIYKNEYGATKIKITPHTRKGNTDSKYDSSFSVYGVLICYTVDGKQKSARQDMTYDLKNKGYYEFGLAYGSKSKVGSVSVTYFNMLDTPKSSWPKKDDCYN